MYVSEQWSTLKWTTPRFLQSCLDLQVMAAIQRFREFLFSTDWNTLPGARATGCIITMFQFTQWHVKSPLSEMLHSPTYKTEKKTNTRPEQTHRWLVWCLWGSVVQR